MYTPPRLSFCIMLKPGLPIVSRVRSTRTHTRHIKYGWKPPPTQEQAVWGTAVSKYLKHYANLRPDAFAPLSDLVRISSCQKYISLTPRCKRNSQFIPQVEQRQIFEWVKNDHMRRFELVTDVERPGPDHPEWNRTTYIRARKGHSIPVRQVFFCIKCSLIYNFT